MNEDELRASIALLRERRAALPELRDYRPQSRGKKASAPSEPSKPLEETFAGLFVEEPSTGESQAG